MKSLTNCIYLVFFVAISAIGQVQDSELETIKLLKPSGPFNIGTMIYEWTDRSRSQDLSNHYENKRTIITQLWYPAEIDSASIKAQLSSLSKDYQHVQTNSYVESRFNGTIEKAHVIFISPGRGTERYLYTSISEELASHGYVVASIDMPEIGYTIYSNGQIIKPSQKYKPPRGMMAGPYEKVDAFYEIPTQIGFTDIKFALDKLRDLNAQDPNNRFTDKFNLDETGIFGHSLGGRIAGKFAKEISAVKGYISMEGIPPRDIRYNGLLKIPIAMLCSSGTWPYAKENYFSLIINRKSDVYMIELPDFGHNSVTDNPYIYPNSFNYSVDPAKALIITRHLILSYFNDVVRKSDSFKDRLNSLEGIKVSIHE